MKPHISRNEFKEHWTKVGIIDIGSNAVRFHIIGGQADNRFVRLYFNREPVRLGKDVFTHGVISSVLMAKLTERIIQFRTHCHNENIYEFRVIATAAMRQAKNNTEVIAFVKKRSGLSIEIISPEEESRYTYCGVMTASGIDVKNSLIIDIGGGSTEIIRAGRKKMLSNISYELGAVRNAVDGLDNHQEYERAFQTMTDSISAALQTVRRDVGGLYRKNAYGIGGTLNAIADIISAKYSVPRDDLSLTHAHVLKLRNYFYLNPPYTVEHIPGLSAERRDIIVTGIEITMQLMTQLGLHAVHILNTGVADGVAAYAIRGLLNKRIISKDANCGE